MLYEHVALGAMLAFEEFGKTYCLRLNQALHYMIEHNVTIPTDYDVVIAGGGMTGAVGNCAGATGTGWSPWRIALIEAHQPQPAHPGF